MQLRRDYATKSGTVLDAGEVMLVTRSYRGLHLERLAVCTQCGRRTYQNMIYIPETEVDLMPRDFAPKNENLAINVVLTAAEQEAIFKLRHAVTPRSPEYYLLHSIIAKMQWGYRDECAALPQR